MGYEVTDTNGEQLMGFARAQANLRNGRRCSTSKAFIRPIAARPNLHISMKSWVTRILVDPVSKIATGVEFVKQHQRYIVKARREVILSAGTIASPQLLMLSGIGPRVHLAELGIPVKRDLQVGYNLQDHVTLNGLVFTVNETKTLNDRHLMNPTDILHYILEARGPYTIPGGAEGFAFMRTPNSTIDKDMEIVLGAGSLSGDHMGSLRDLLEMPDEFYHKVYEGLHEKETFGLVPVLLRPSSRGRISLRSTNPFHWPRMEPNYMQDPDDIRAMLEGVQMGPPSDAAEVVDPQLRVHGIKHLRVVDASIMPTKPAGHMNAIVIMIAEKAADMLKICWRMRY